MPKMHWCTARVNLAGNGYTVVWFDTTSMVSWPEIQVIMLLHGEENVFEIKARGIGETSIAAEKERLQLKYGFKPVEHVFPGRAPRMETLMPAETQALPLTDMYGAIVDPHALISANGNGHPVEEPPAPTPPPVPPDNQDDDEDGEETAGPAEPPSGPAVFKPGKHPRPAKGA